jgi:hypothetical protein
MQALRDLQQFDPDHFPAFLHELSLLWVSISNDLSFENDKYKPRYQAAPEHERAIINTAGLRQEYSPLQGWSLAKHSPFAVEKQLPIMREDKRIFEMIKLSEMEILHLMFEQFNASGFDEEDFLRFAMQKVYEEIGGEGYSRRQLMMNQAIFSFTG